jgi:flagellar basal body-associated protein FliL
MASIKPPVAGLIVFNRILLGILIVQMLFIAGISSAVFLKKTPQSAATPPLSAERFGAAQSPSRMYSEKTFGGIGRIRAALKAERNMTPATVIIEPYFSYNSEDRAFYEELAMHIREFRSATLDFFAELPASSPILNDDAAIKNKLLERYNGVLRLGKIDKLYFTDFMVIQ